MLPEETEGLEICGGSSNRSFFLMNYVVLIIITKLGGGAKFLWPSQKSWTWIVGQIEFVSDTVSIKEVCNGGVAHLGPQQPKM